MGIYNNLEIDTLTEQECIDLIKTLHKRVNDIQSEETKVRLSKTKTFQGHSYIITDGSEIEYEDGWLIGFNLSNEKEGYIGDHVPDEVADDFGDLLSVLRPYGLYGEVVECTYNIDKDKVDAVRKILNDLGFKEEDPAW